MEKQCLRQLARYKVGVIRLLLKGEEGICELGWTETDPVDSELAVSSDLGTNSSTMTIALRELEKLGEIPYYQDKTHSRMVFW